MGEKRDEYRGLWENLKEIDNLQDLEVDEIKILNKTERHALDSFGLR
jgi:hypothetical protein